MKRIAKPRQFVGGQKSLATLFTIARDPSRRVRMILWHLAGALCPGVHGRHRRRQPVRCIGRRRREGVQCCDMRPRESFGPRRAMRRSDLGEASIIGNDAFGFELGGMSRQEGVAQALNRQGCPLASVGGRLGLHPIRICARASSAAVRAWSGVISPMCPSTNRRCGAPRPPGDGRYSRTNTIKPLGLTSAPNPANVSIEFGVWFRSWFQRVNASLRYLPPYEHHLST